MAFVSAIPLTYTNTNNNTKRNINTHRRSSTRQTPISSAKNHQQWPSYDAEHWANLDTLSGFEALCVRTQTAVCNITAAADGLGTFEALPATAPNTITSSSASSRNRKQTSSSNGATPGARLMRGGLAFERAVVSVWRTPTPRTGRRDAHVSTDAVGLSLRLQPRDNCSPALRADVHYYQRGASGTGAWWFSGAADLTPGKASSPNVFSRDVQTFLSGVLPPTGTGSMTYQYPHKCSVPAVCAETADRAGAFAFVVRVVDVLLPAYLPLVDGAQTRALTLPLDTAPTPTSHHSQRRPRHPRARLRFGVPGGASCESDVALAHEDSLGWWRFTLAPRAGTPQSSLFYRMRDSHTQSGM